MDYTPNHSSTPPKKLYSLKKYIMILVVTFSLSIYISAGILGLLGFGERGVLFVVLFSFPLLFYSGLHGFYRGLKKHYGFSPDKSISGEASDDS